VDINEAVVLGVSPAGLEEDSIHLEAVAGLIHLFIGQGADVTELNEPRNEPRSWSADGGLNGLDDCGFRGFRGCHGVFHC